MPFCHLMLVIKNALKTPRISSVGVPMAGACHPTEPGHDGRARNDAYAGGRSRRRGSPGLFGKASAFAVALLALTFIPAQYAAAQTNLTIVLEGPVAPSRNAEVGDLLTLDSTVTNSGPDAITTSTTTTVTYYRGQMSGLRRQPGTVPPPETPLCSDTADLTLLCREGTADATAASGLANGVAHTDDLALTPAATAPTVAAGTVFHYFACLSNTDDTDASDNCSPSLFVRVFAVRPDLRISAASAPATAMAGTAFNFITEVTNGGTLASGTEDLTFYQALASRAPTEAQRREVGNFVLSGIIPSGVIEVTPSTTPTVGGLAAGATTAPVVTSLTPPDDTVTGNYIYFVCVDGPTAETLTDNNCSLGLTGVTAPGGTEAVDAPAVSVTALPTAAITASNPDTLTEANLNGATLTVTLADTAYANSLDAAQFMLVTTVSGVTVASVSGMDTTNAVLTLDYDGSNFDTDAMLGVTVTDAAHTGTGDLTTASVTVEVDESRDATLSGLTLSGGAMLNPAFAAGTLTYTADVANDVADIMVTPTATDGNATIAVNGTAVTSGSASTAITLTAGAATDIAVVVTAEDGTTTQTYDLAVTRAAAAPPAPDLSIDAALVPSGTTPQEGKIIATTGTPFSLTATIINRGTAATPTESDTSNPPARFFLYRSSGAIPATLPENDCDPGPLASGACVEAQAAGDNPREIDSIDPNGASRTELFSGLTLGVEGDYHYFACAFVANEATPTNADNCSPVLTVVADISDTGEGPIPDDGGRIDFASDIDQFRLVSNSFTAGNTYTITLTGGAAARLRLVYNDGTNSGDPVASPLVVENVPTGIHDIQISVVAGTTSFPVAYTGLTVVDTTPASIDLSIVLDTAALPTNVDVGDALILRSTVTNDGEAITGSTTTTVTYYRSSTGRSSPPSSNLLVPTPTPPLCSTTTANLDTLCIEGTASATAASGLAVNAEQANITLTPAANAPAVAANRTFHYFACLSNPAETVIPEVVDAITINNPNCTASEQVAVRTLRPDLRISAVTAPSNATAGTAFTFTTEVTNGGTAASGQEALTFYQVPASPALSAADRREIISDVFASLGTIRHSVIAVTPSPTPTVGGLGIGAVTDPVITTSLTPPANTAAGDYLYFVCVDDPTLETNTDNNCSLGLTGVTAPDGTEAVDAPTVSVTALPPVLTVTAPVVNDTGTTLSYTVSNTGGTVANGGATFSVYRRGTESTDPVASPVSGELVGTADQAISGEISTATSPFDVPDITIDTPVDATNYYYYVCVTAATTPPVTACSRTSNVVNLTGDLTITAAPANIPASLMAGANFPNDISVTVDNIGNGQAPQGWFLNFFRTATRADAGSVPSPFPDDCTATETSLCWLGRFPATGGQAAIPGLESAPPVTGVQFTNPGHTAPTAPGTYHYFACVVAPGGATGDSNRTNQCGTVDESVAVTVTAVGVVTAAITATVPTSLTEANLDGATLTVTLTGTTYETSLPANSVTLNTAATTAGVTVTAVRVSATEATLTLAFDRAVSDFDTDLDIIVTVAAVAHAGTGDLDTGTVTVTAVMESSNADLSALELSEGMLDPGFAAATLTYTAMVDNSVRSLTLTPTAADAGASIAVAGTAVDSGMASERISLAVGANFIFVVVTAADGSTMLTYTVTVMRASMPGRVTATISATNPSPLTERNLNGAMLTITLTNSEFVDPLPATGGFSVSQSPIFGGIEDTSFSSIVRVDATTVILTLIQDGTDFDSDLTLAINIGSRVHTAATSLDASPPVPVMAVMESSNADLRALELSEGMLTPGFAAATLTYTAMVDNSVSSLTLTPTAADDGAGITVDGAVVASGAASDPVELDVGPNLIDVVVTAEDGPPATVTYMVTVTRMAAAITLSGDTAGAVTEDDNTANTATGTLTVANPGGSTDVVAPTESGTYGAFVIAADTGAWTYTLDNADDDTNALAAGDIDRETFTIAAAADPIVTQVVTITITGANDAPDADAGPDQPAVAPSATVMLDGSASADPDTGDAIVSYAWTQDSGTDVTLSATTVVSPTFTAPDDAATLVFSLVVNDGDVDSVADTVTITVTGAPAASISATNPPSLTEANLEGATLSVTLANTVYASPLGAGSFALNTEATDAGVVVADSVVRDSDTQATLTLNYADLDFDDDIDIIVTVPAASHTGAGDLTTGAVTVTAVVETSRLSALTLSAGTLDPVFDAEIFDYIASVVNSVDRIAVTPTVAAGVEILVNGNRVNSGEASQGIMLNVGSTNVITVIVTGAIAPAQTYTLTITRAAAPTATISATVPPSLTEATLNGATLTVTLANTTYENLLPASLITLNTAAITAGVTATAVRDSDIQATLTLAFDRATSDFDDNLDIRVTVPDAAHRVAGNLSTGAVTVTAIVESSDATLSGLSLSGGAVLAPVFAPTTLTYTADVANDVAEIMVTPTATDAAGATIAVDGTAVNSGAASTAIALTAGVVTPITVLVTAEDGTTQTYTLAVTRAAAPTAAIATPASLTEAALNSATVTVMLTNTEYVPGVLAANLFTVTLLSGSGVTVSTATRTSEVLATLTLAYGGTGIDANTTLGVRVGAAAHSGAGDLDTATIPVTATPPSLAGDTFTVAENTAAATPVGTPLVPDNFPAGSQTWAIVSGNTGNDFAINPSTGQLTVAANDSINFEDTPSYTLMVSLTIGAATAQATVAVTVTDVDEPPAAPAAPTVAAAAESLIVNWTAPVNSGPAITGYDVRYRVGSTGAYTDAADPGTATSLTITGLTAATLYEVQVRAVNAEGMSAYSAPGTGTPLSSAAPTASITTTVPGTLTEANLNGAMLTVTLSNATYVGPLTASQFTLAGAPGGAMISVESVTGSGTQAALVLAYPEAGADLDSDLNLSVVVAAAAHSGDDPLTTAPVTVADNAAPVISNPGSQSYVQDAPITVLTITVTDDDGDADGNPPVVTLMNLPNGLMFDGTDQVSGTPTALGDTEVTITAVDGVNDMVTDTFSITVNAAALSFGGATITAQTYTMDTAITDLTLPVASGGTGTLSYAIIETLPSGLSFDTDTRVLSGTPNAVQALTTYTYTATDAATSPAMVTLVFTITITAPPIPDTNGPPTFAPAGNPTIVYVVGAPAPNLQLVSASGGDGMLVYSIDPTPALPPTLSFNPATRILSGVPATAVFPATDFTYRVADSDVNNTDADTDTIILNISVEADVPPAFALGTAIPAQRYTVNTAITPPVTLPVATGGNERGIFGAPSDITYTITPDLPAGLTFNAAATPPTITGTPQTVQTTASTHTYRAADEDANTADSDAATLNFTVTIPSAPIVISGETAGAVTEDAATATATGTLTVTNSGGGGTEVVAQTDDGTYGTFSIVADTRVWTYTLNNAAGSATDVLAANAMETDVFTVVAAADPRATTDVTITITGANDAPTVTISAPADGTDVEFGTALTLTATGEDPDTGTTLSYAWSANPNVGSFTDAAVASTTWTAPAGGTAPVTLTLTVTDDATPPLSGTAEVTVNPVAMAPPSAAIATPSSLTEATLEGATVTVMLTSTEYVGTLAANLFGVTLSGGATGVSVSAVTRTSAVLATLTLAYGGTGIDANTTLGVRVGAAAHTGAGDLDTATIPVTATAPSLPNATFSVAENAAANTPVGTPLVPDNFPAGSQTWAIVSGNTGNDFAINPSTGQLTVAADDSINFEDTPSYTLEVSLTIGAATAQATVTVTVTDVEEVPSAPAAPTVTPGVESLAVTWTAPDNNGPAITGYNVEYRLSSSAPAGAYTDAGHSGTTPDITIPGLMASVEYQVRVRATNAEGDGPYSALGMGTPMAPTTPTATISTPTTAIAEADLSGTELAVTLSNTEYVGTLAAVQFTINHGTGASGVTVSGVVRTSPTVATLTLAYTSGIDADTTLGVTVAAAAHTGDDALTTDNTVMVTATPPSLAGATFTVAENTAADMNVGTPLAAAEFPAGSQTWAIVSGNTGNDFAINPSTGQLTVAADDSINFEDTPSYTLEVSLTIGAATAQATVTVTVTDVEEVPSAPAAPTVTPGVESLAVTWTAPDNNGPAITGYNVEYRLSSSAPAGVYTDAGHSGTTPDITIPGLMASVEYQVRVRATNAEGDGPYSALGTGTPMAPTTPTATISTPTTAIAEADLSGTELAVTLSNTEYVGTLAAVQFTINHGTGASGVTVSNVVRTGNTVATLTLAYTSGIDADTTLGVTVVAAAHTGDDALTTDNTVMVTATPPSLAGATFTVAENTAADMNVGTPLAAAEFPSGTQTWAIVSGNTGGDFNIAEATGQLTVAANDSINFEDTPSYTLEVSLTIGAATAQATVAVTVDDVDEPPSAPAAPTVTAGAVSLNVDWTAPDNNGPAITGYNVQFRTGSDPFTVASPGPGAATSLTITGLTASMLYEVQVRAVNAEGNGAYSASGSGTPLAATAPTASIPTTVPSTLTEANLDGAMLTVTLTNATYMGTLMASQFTLTGTPGAAMISVASVMAVSTTQAVLELSYTGTDLDSDLNLRVVVDAAAHSGTNPLTTAAVAVDDNVAPVIVNPGPQSYVQNAPITALTITVNDADGDGAGTSPTVTLTSLPTGLVFDGTDQVTGTPTELGDTVVSITADDGVNDRVTATFTITVTSSGGALSFGGATIDAQTYTVNTAITDLTLPVVTGGTGPYGYALLGMPSGLSFNAMTRVLSGTPDTEQGATTYTYTATDSALSPAAVTLSLMITVEPGSGVTGGPLEVARSEAMEMTLGAFGRSFTSGAVEVLGERFSSGAGGSQLTFGGRTLSLESLRNGQAAANAGDESDNQQPVPAAAGGQQTSVGALFAGSAFQLSLNEGDAAGVGATTLWARGSVGNYEGEPEDGFQLDGDIVSGYLGLDYRASRRTLVGVAVSHSRGDADFSSAAIADGEVETELTSILPYVQWQPRAGLSVWGLVGYGLGESEITDSGQSRKTDVEMQTAALGARGKLWSGGRADVALKASALTVEIESDSEQNLSSVTTRAHRLRMALAGNRHGAASARGGRFGQRFELGLRWDLGDVETGAGADLGAGVEYANPRSGTRLRLDGHYLLVHEESDFEAWEVSAEVGITPSLWGRGVRFALQPGWDSAGARQRMVMDFTDVLGPAWRGDGLKLELYGEHAEDHEFGLEGSVRY